VREGGGGGGIVATGHAFFPSLGTKGEKKNANGQQSLRPAADPSCPGARGRRDGATHRAGRARQASTRAAAGRPRRGPFWCALLSSSTGGRREEAQRKERGGGKEALSFPPSPCLGPSFLPAPLSAAPLEGSRPTLGCNWMWVGEGGRGGAKKRKAACLCTPLCCDVCQTRGGRGGVGSSSIACGRAGFAGVACVYWCVGCVCARGGCCRCSSLLWKGICCPPPRRAAAAAAAAAAAGGGGGDALPLLPRALKE